MMKKCLGIYPPMDVFEAGNISHGVRNASLNMTFALSYMEEVQMGLSDINVARDSMALLPEPDRFMDSYGLSTASPQQINISHEIGTPSSR